ncbi:hypothetical protein BC939DRAFT_443162 [Gamsiella multidivaricata]|uniref:uncharacterized protein n=1 Tax=Gamsiella multidivaricata TaxID=101098 RepID=UPI00221F2F1A|nr:uncharacterized protein BC939DRAFT_443162 [Gamsiella multidivaricata]KAG0370007.1 hypothetical protein BGZ54_008090 [Gamsiella multidivaricata]KAI7828529.1 hypothetical protein BC939DRAFT_443162 [Gamsiella multidivaricata]
MSNLPSLHSLGSAGIARPQHGFPPEIWTSIIQHLSLTDHFSLYNTSKFLRALSIPFLIQSIASKSVRLFLYQEYVCRTGVTFVFDHFDMNRDRVVFKPQLGSQTIAFRSGIAIQRPQLEEISVRSRGSRFQERQIHCTEDGIITVGKEGTKSYSGVKSGQPDAPTSMKSAERHPGHLVRHAESGFASLNYLDRVCPLSIKRHGSQILRGAQHSFGRNYHWALHYSIDDQNSKLVKSSRSNNNSFSRDHRSLSASTMNDVTKTYTRGNRHVHAIRFECSINFLDPRRASRSVLRRWLEGKMSQLLQIVRMRQTTATLARKENVRNVDQRANASYQSSPVPVVRVGA